MQREGLRKGYCSELYFETKHNCTGKRTGRLPGSERRRPVPSTGHSSGSLRPSASVPKEEYVASNFDKAAGPELKIRADCFSSGAVTTRDNGGWWDHRN